MLKVVLNYQVGRTNVIYHSSQWWHFPRTILELFFLSTRGRHWESALWTVTVCFDLASSLPAAGCQSFLPSFFLYFGYSMSSDNCWHTVLTHCVADNDLLSSPRWRSCSSRAMKQLSFSLRPPPRCVVLFIAGPHTHRRHGPPLASALSTRLQLVLLCVYIPRVH